uniref:diacylglycerol lipase-alpha-like isoform X1 n=1 Tax=Styela clava TaxID=7725 RepID=UPI001939C0E1|nr:diacylglycerol lipase-alpha-like isoform X1 [Styela clava]
MPGMIAFKRRWGTGSDDLVVPGMLLFLMHLILFIVIAVIISTSPELDKYASYDLNALSTSVIYNKTLYDQAACAHEIRDYSIGYLVLAAVAAIIEILLTLYSMQGTIMNPEPRKPVEYLIYIRMAFGVIEMAYSILTTVQISLHWRICGVLRDLYNIQIDIFSGIVIVNIIVFLIVVLVGYCVFDPAGGKYYKVKNAYKERMSASYIEQMRNELDSVRRQTWLSRLSNCFCCVSNNSTNIKQVALDEVSMLLHNFFKEHDLVMSDIIAGLTLLRHKQQCIENDTTVTECWCREQVMSNDENDVEEFMCGRAITPDTNFVDLSNTVTKQECEDLAYYCVYGLAAYGPLFYWVENTGTGLCGVLQECLCSENPTCTSRCCIGAEVARRRKTLIKGDSGCGWAIAGIKKSLTDHGVNTEVVYVSFENDVSKQPFFLSVDHEKRSVVVTVRGTLAEADALTDLVASSEYLDTEENDGTWRAHKGMVDGAEYIKKKLLQEEMVLSLGFGHCISKGTKDYNLVLVGHSLGAGIASILAILLHPIYRNLKCYAFSPPGGLLSHSAVMASKDYIHTLIFGKDIVPRAGLSQLESLRNEVLDLLKHTKTPKYQIILGNLCNSIEHRHGLLRSERLNSRAVRLGARPTNSVSANTTEMVSTATEELFPPGRIFHLVYSNDCISEQNSKKKKKYYMIYGDNVNDFNQVIVSHQMISHHLPQEVLRCVRKAIHNFPTDRINRSYAQSATLPYTENKSNSMQSNKDKNRNKTIPVVEQPHTSLIIESPVQTHHHHDEEVDGHHDSDVSEDSDHPFLNTNQNNVNITDEIRGTPLSTSSSASSMSHDATAPLARPESFTLSLPGHYARSPVSKKTFGLSFRSPENVKADVVPNACNETTDKDRLLTPIPQASSTPSTSTKRTTTDTATSSPFNAEGFQIEEQDDSNISCDDVSVDVHGTNAVS